jgi:hypothetical protein
MCDICGEHGMCQAQIPLATYPWSGRKCGFIKKTVPWHCDDRVVVQYPYPKGFQGDTGLVISRYPNKNSSNCMGGCSSKTSKLYIRSLRCPPNVLVLGGILQTQRNLSYAWKGSSQTTGMQKTTVEDRQIKQFVVSDTLKAYPNTTNNFFASRIQT